MTQICTLRFWLLTGASCLLAGQAQAQFSGQTKPTPPYGAPTMVQAAPSFTDLSPEQIAADVTQEYNRRTGQLEWVGASFDPFERDPGLAASVRLTSANGAFAIDGQQLGDGALLDVNFYYNSPSDDPFGGRGYADAAFLNGELAAPVTRDNRILECSTRVENVVYEHQAYYGGPALGFFRPQPRYFGHFGFADQGFGLGFNNGFGGNFIGNGFGFGGVGFNNRRFNNRNGVRLRDARQENRELRRELEARDSRAQARREVEQERRLRREQDTRNLNRVESFDGRRNTRGGPQRGVNAARRLEIANPEAAAQRQRNQARSTPQIRENLTQQNLNRENRSRETLASDPRARGLARQALETGRIRLDRPQTRRNTAPQTSAPQTAAPQRAAPRAQPRAQPRPAPRAQTPQLRRESRPARSQPRRAAPPPQRSAPTRRSLPRPSITNRSKRQLNFFPNSGAGVSNVVTTTSVDCAREETLRVFIPADRLDAARFDGLTMVVLDREGGQTPLFVPPNYIQGFSLAASQYVPPQGIRQNVPNGTLTRVPQPAQRFETARCPAGTISQPDGTCLLTNGRN